MASVRNVAIVGKFAIILCAFGTMAVLWALYSAAAMREIDEGYTQAISHQGLVAGNLAEASQFLNETRAAIGELEIATSDDANARAMTELRESRRHFSDVMYAAKAVDSRFAEAIDRLATRERAIVDTECSRAIDQGQTSTTSETVAAAQTEFLRSCGTAFPPLLKDMTTLTQQARDDFSKLSRHLAADTRRTIRIGCLGLLGSLITVLIGSYFAVTGWISQPIGALVGTMARLAKGDLSVAVIDVDRKDEIGPMARAVQVFKDNGLKLREGDERRAEIQSEQQRVMSALAQGLADLARGDLTHTLDRAFAPDYETLRTDFNAMVGSLRDALRTIAMATEGIDAGSSEIAQASDHFAQRTERQAASLEETAAALDLITQTVRTMAAGASEAAQVAATTRAAVEASGSIVQQAIEAMGKIKDSSNEISHIVGVIDDIASQTNLLSLNAAIEAAGAGDAGRGFAVVASEVRSLAQRSAEAAKEIKTLIRASTDQVESGVGLVGKTGAALLDIIGKVAAMDALVRVISSSSHEQALSLAEVNTAVGQMDQVVQQNAAMVEESTAAAHTLRSDMQHLTAMIARFHLDNDTAFVRNAGAGAQTRAA